MPNFQPSYVNKEVPGIVWCSQHVLKLSGHIYVHDHSFWTPDLGFRKLGNFGSTIVYPQDISTPGPSFRLLDV